MKRGLLPCLAVLGALAPGAGPALAGPTAPEATIRLTSAQSGRPEPILSEGLEQAQAGLGAPEPLRFRGCFRTPLSLGLLTESYMVYDRARPPQGRFPCGQEATDRGSRLGADLAAGLAVAFLSERNIAPGIDRVVAIYPDGRAYAWQQLNESAEK